MAHSYCVERLSDLFRPVSISPSKGPDVPVSDTLCYTNSLRIIMSDASKNRCSCMSVNVTCKKKRTVKIKLKFQCGCAFQKTKAI